MLEEKEVVYEELWVPDFQTGASTSPSAAQW